jgi:hypothetical protein
MRTKEEIISAFTYHPPVDPDVKRFYEYFRDEMQRKALYLYDEMPECAERTIAMRHLEQAVMYANAGVARHGTKGGVGSAA